MKNKYSCGNAITINHKIIETKDDHHWMYDKEQLNN